MAHAVCASVFFLEGKHILSIRRSKQAKFYLLSHNLLHVYTVFHAEGRVPPQTQVPPPPSGFARSATHFVLHSYTNSIQSPSWLDIACGRKLVLEVGNPRTLHPPYETLDSIYI